MNTLNTLLDEAGLNKRQLSDMLGVALSTVYHWEDEPPAYAIAYLRLYLGRQGSTLPNLDLMDSAIQVEHQVEKLHDAARDLVRVVEALSSVDA